MSKVITNLIEAHVFRETGNGLEFLLLKRAETEIYPGLWQMVSGKIKKGEKAFETALREIREETGIIPRKIWTVPNINSFYDPEEDCISVLPVFAALADSNAAVRISPEHTEFMWLGRQEAKKILAWKGQRDSVDAISEYFTEERGFLDLVEIRLK